MRGREYTLASGEDRLLHVGRHPAVNAVADDVVEPPHGEIHAPNVLIDELDVVHAEFPYPQTSVLDLRGRQIDSHRPRPGIGRREREQVARGCTTDLQHARGGHFRRLQSEDPSEGRKVSRRRLRVGKRLVRRLVVGRP